MSPTPLDASAFLQPVTVKKIGRTQKALGGPIYLTRRLRQGLGMGSFFIWS